MDKKKLEEKEKKGEQCEGMGKKEKEKKGQERKNKMDKKNLEENEKKERKS